MYKLEMHLHTKNNSSCGKETPEDIIERYKCESYDGIVCTNHFSKYIYYKYFQQFKTSKEKIDMYLKAFYELKDLGQKAGIDVFFGMELALNDDDYHNILSFNCAEILVYGITDEDFVKYNISLAEKDYEKLFDMANEHNWLLVQAHPFRSRTKQVDARFLHGIESYNGHPYHNSRNSLAEERAAKYGLIKTAGSDFHVLGYEGTGMYFERRVENEKDLVWLLKNTRPQIFKRNKE